MIVYQIGGVVFPVDPLDIDIAVECLDQFSAEAPTPEDADVPWCPGLAADYHGGGCAGPGSGEDFVDVVGRVWAVVGAGEYVWFCKSQRSEEEGGEDGFHVW